VQRIEPLVRQWPASADHRGSFSKYNHVRRSAKRLCSHCKWKSVCFVLCRGHQRKDGEHSCHEQSAVGGHDHGRRDLRCWNSQRDGQYSERELWQSRLHERWKQPRSRLDNDLTASLRRGDVLLDVLGGNGEAGKHLRLIQQTAHHMTSGLILVNLHEVDSTLTRARRSRFRGHRCVSMGSPSTASSDDPHTDRLTRVVTELICYRRPLVPEQ
jgi:hypothetical protein